MKPDPNSAKSPRKSQKAPLPPWMFNGEPFTQEMVGDLAGFVYEITCPDGKRYIGRKYFWSNRKPAPGKRRKKVPSDWEKYFSSSKTIKELVKKDGPEGFSRSILSLHELERDVNYTEVAEQFKRNVLGLLDDKGERVYINDNISGKYFPKFVIGLESRSQYPDYSVPGELA